jgi:hypothetical protein
VPLLASRCSCCSCNSCNAAIAQCAYWCLFSLQLLASRCAQAAVEEALAHRQLLQQQLQRGHSAGAHATVATAAASRCSCCCCCNSCNAAIAQCAYHRSHSPVCRSTFLNLNLCPTEVCRSNIFTPEPKPAALLKPGPVPQYAAALFNKPLHLAAGVEYFCSWSRKLLFITEAKVHSSVHSYVEVRPTDVPRGRPKDAPDERSAERCFAAYYRHATQGMLTYADISYESYADVC